MNESMKNPQAWKPADADIQGTKAFRSASLLVDICKQFEVETNPRYVRGHDGIDSNGLETYCNIYQWDCTRALGCEVPHWVDPATGVSVPVGKGKELSANGVCDWFKDHGLDSGWMLCGEEQARERASAGFPTVVLWKNQGGIGHVAMVLPGTDFTHIAQAGVSNFFNDRLQRGFGARKDLVFYSHD